jgi:hypothetical protein
MNRNSAKKVMKMKFPGRQYKIMGNSEKVSRTIE